MKIQAKEVVSLLTIQVWKDTEWKNQYRRLCKTYLEEGNSCDAPGNLVAYLYKKMPLYAYEFSGECFDIGTHEALAEVNELYSK